MLFIFCSFYFLFSCYFFPKERKKAKCYLLLSNRISFIRRETQVLFRTLFQTFKSDLNADDLTEKGIDEYCKKINPHLSISVIDLNTLRNFHTYFEYFTIWAKRIKSWIQNLIPLYDIIQDDTFNNLTELYDYLESHLNFEFATPGNTDLEFLSSTFYDLNKQTKELLDTFRSKYKGYTLEFHHFKRKQNLQKLKIKS